MQNIILGSDGIYYDLNTCQPIHHTHQAQAPRRAAPIKIDDMTASSSMFDLKHSASMFGFD